MLTRPAAFLAAVWFLTAPLLGSEILNIPASHDAHASSSRTTFNVEELTAGFRNFDGGPQEYRAAVRFALPDSLRGKQIESAKLKLYYFDAWGSFAPRVITAFPALDAWTESSLPFDLPRSADGVPATVGTQSFGWIEWAIDPGQVTAWLDNPASNHGLVLVADPSGPADNAMRFCSREHGNASQRPVLEIRLPGIDPPMPPYPGRASAPSFIASGYDSILAGADVLYGEAIVEKTSPGTFYAVLLGEAFYFGLQQGGSGYNKHVHFAVWDPADPLVFQGSGVNAQRFGGEGTGWTTYYPFEWKTNVSYGFLAQISPAADNSTLYRAYFYDPESGLWKHLATIRRNVMVPGLKLFGSFLEDFGEMNWIDRSFLVGRQQARYDGGRWADLRRGYFNCSIGWSNPYTNSFNGEVSGEYFRLATGGSTIRKANPGDIMNRSASEQAGNLPVDRPLMGSLTVGGGAARIAFNGARGLLYKIQSSPDLDSWTEAAAFTPARERDAIEIAAEADGSRFYRAVLLQP